MAALDGVDEKIERAKVHQADLAQQLEAVLGNGKQRFVLEPDPETGWHALRVFGVPALDPEWRTIIGDCLFNLRSALDHLAWELVHLDGKIPTDEDMTTFPIWESPFTKKGKPRTLQLKPAVSCQDILDAVEKVQPYVDTGSPPEPPSWNPLWELHRLNIIDKHRQLLVVVNALNPHATTSAWSGGVDLAPKFHANWVAIRKEGMPVGWYEFPGGAPPDDFNWTTALHLVIREDELLHLSVRSVENVLLGMILHVEHMLEFRFRPLF